MTAYADTPRSGTGRTPTTTDDQLLAMLPATTNDIAATTGLDRNTISYRLRRLRAEGRAHRGKPGFTWYEGWKETRDGGRHGPACYLCGQPVSDHSMGEVAWGCRR